MQHLHQADVDAVSASLAAPFDLGDRPSETRPFYARAARRAVAVSAHEEAIRLLRKALSIPDRDPSEGERGRLELSLRLELATSVSLVRGYASPELRGALRAARRQGNRLVAQRILHSLDGAGG